MTDDPVKIIHITNEVPFEGNGDSLEARLRRVTLKGFPDIAIYKNARFEAKKLNSRAIKTTLHSPQLHVYTAHLNRVSDLAAIFLGHGIDIYHLDRAYDYISVAESGKKTEWTMLPPVVERFTIPLNGEGTLNYKAVLSSTLRKAMAENNWQLNPEIDRLHHMTETFNLINDGSHRVHAALKTGNGITVLQISGTTPGYPYYAVPQAYQVKEFGSKETAPELKIHVLTSPGHKQLYRSFPSGGIKSGAVRAPKKGEHII